MRHSNQQRKNMQVITKMLWTGFDQNAPVATKAKGKTVVDKKLKTHVDSFKSFAEAPFQAEVVVYETAEDLLE